MNKFVIAATSLVLASGAAYAQDAAKTEDPTLMQQAETAAQQSAAEAEKAAEAAGAAVENAADSAADATADAADAAADSAEKAADSAAEAADAATDAADETMATGGQGTTADAPMTEGNSTTMPAGETPMAADAPAVVADPALVEKATGKAAVVTAENPGMLGSWIMNRHIWTTNQPSDSAMIETAPAERPAEWSDIAKVDDLVIDKNGDLVGYVADIGGFLGIGAKQVLLGADQLGFMQIGDDAFYVTNMTKEELEALPDFDKQIVMQ